MAWILTKLYITQSPKQSYLSYGWKKLGLESNFSEVTTLENGPARLWNRFIWPQPSHSIVLSSYAHEIHTHTCACTHTHTHTHTLSLSPVIQQSRGKRQNTNLITVRNLYINSNVVFKNFLSTDILWSSVDNRIKRTTTVKTTFNILKF